MSGTGPQLYMAITSNTPSTATMLKAHRLFVDYSPYIKVTHFFSTKTILDAFEGADRVHLVDYGVAYGAQWPCLIQRLSQRKGGPPHLRITCKSNDVINYSSETNFSTFGRMKSAALM